MVSLQYGMAPEISRLEDFDKSYDVNQDAVFGIKLNSELNKRLFSEVVEFAIVAD